MRTIALRFSNNFAPAEGTIRAHEAVITETGFVWYGKLGNKISSRVKSEILENESPRILLIHSGAAKRYWAYINRIQYETPPLDQIPAYYRERAKDFSTWFRIFKFEETPRDIMAHCYVTSSGTLLSMASRHSMSPYFIISYDDSKTCFQKKTEVDT